MKRIILCVAAVTVSAYAFAQNTVYDTVVRKNGHKATLVITPKIAPVTIFEVDSVPVDFTSREITQIMRGEKVVKAYFHYGSLFSILPIMKFKNCSTTYTYAVEQSSDGRTKIKKVNSKEEFVSIEKSEISSLIFFYLPFFLIILFSLPGPDTKFHIQEKQRVNNLLRIYAILLFGITGFLSLCYFNQISLISFCVLLFLVFVAQLSLLDGFSESIFTVIGVLITFSGALYIAIYPYSRIENYEHYRIIIFELLICFIGFLITGFLVRKAYRAMQSKFRFLLANRV